jgi:hypothetical protein
VSLPLLADENFGGDILRGLHRRQPDPDILRVQDAGLTGVVVVPQSLPIGTAIEEILVVSEIVTIEELRDQVLYLPLR